MGSMISGIGNMYSGMKGAIDEQQAAQVEWNTNDALAQYQARGARIRGRQEEGKVRVAGAQLSAEQRMAYANSGVDENVGTAANTQANTTALNELDAQTVKNNAAREAWGFKVQQEQAHQTYKAKVAAAQNKAIGSVLTGAGQLLGGAASL